ncbi:MAG TPA: hypothetical protein PLN52_14070 [Opitutaceae bacterium]|nr:hypothetical protein [Opitutaceae bacterium]
MKLRLSTRSTSLLGLVFDQAGVHVAQATLHASQIEVRSGTVLNLDLHSGETTPLGQQLAAHLKACQLEEKSCIVALPTDWFMAVATPLPDLPTADVDSFLQLEAESGFPCEHDEVYIVRSPQSIGGRTVITQLAVRIADLSRLSEILDAAGLKPVRYTFSPSVLPDALPSGDSGAASLLLSETPPSFQIGIGGGVAALRALPASIDDLQAIAREVRITIEETSSFTKETLGHLRIFGDSISSQALLPFLAPWASRAAIPTEVREWTPAQSASSLAAQGLQNLPRFPNFLPPRPTRWQQWTQRYSGRRLRSVLALGIVALLGGVSAFGWREYESWTLREDWAAMKPQVDELDGVQARIREFRPWHDTSFRTLNVLRVITEVFPESGTVTAKSFEVRNQTAVTVTGITRDNSALLSSLEKLRQRPDVTNLKVEQIRGKSPAQFTFTFNVARTPGS